MNEVNIYSSAIAHSANKMFHHASALAASGSVVSSIGGLAAMAVRPLATLKAATKAVTATLWSVFARSCDVNNNCAAVDFLVVEC